MLFTLLAAVNHRKAPLVASPQSKTCELDLQTTTPVIMQTTAGDRCHKQRCHQFPLGGRDAPLVLGRACTNTHGGHYNSARAIADKTNSSQHTLRTTSALPRIPHEPSHQISIFGAIWLPKKLAWRRTQPYAVESTAIVNIFFGGAPYGPTNRMMGVPKCVAGYTARTKAIGLNMKA